MDIALGGVAQVGRNSLQLVGFQLVAMFTFHCGSSGKQKEWTSGASIGGCEKRVKPRRFLRQRVGNTVAADQPTEYYKVKSTILRLNLNSVAPVEQGFCPMTSHSTNASLRHVIPLGLLTAGMTATIVEVDGKPDLVVRLHEMGVRPGCDVRMVRPGKACIVAIDNHRFGFRGAEAAHVLVEVAKSDSAAS